MVARRMAQVPMRVSVNLVSLLLLTATHVKVCKLLNVKYDSTVVRLYSRCYYCYVFLLLLFMLFLLTRSCCCFVILIIDIVVIVFVCLMLLLLVSILVSLLTTGQLADHYCQCFSA